MALKRTLDCLLLVCLVACPLARAEDVLVEARALNKSGHSQDAVRLLEAHLQESPDDPDARVLCGLILSWDHRYDEARAQFKQVLAARPAYPDALQGLINVEMWDGHPERAEAIASGGLAEKPNSALLYAKARALRAQNRDQEALTVLRQLLAADPTNREAIDTERSIQESLEQMRVSFSHTTEWFRNGGGSWNQSDLSLSRSTSRGSVAATFSRADRFGLHSNFAEATAYTHIRPGTYTYFGFGFSPDGTLFATYRLGAEVFQSLPHGMEASAGYRRFGFTDATNMYTGSVGKYVGKWLLTTRFFLTPDDLGVTHSVSLSARRFLHHDGDFFEIRAGTGPSPFDPRSREELASLNAYSAYFHIKKSVGPKLLLDALAGSAFEDRLYRVSVEHFILQVELGYRF